MLFSEVLEMWWIGDKLNLREITIHKKRMTIDKHILPFFGTTEINAVDDVMINGFILYEKEQGNRLTGGELCQNSIIKELGIVRAVFDYAYKKGLIKRNPMLLIKKLKRVPVKEFEIFSPEEVQKLIKVARPKWLGDMILLVYNTGLRKCECFGLQWSDVNFDEKYLLVCRSVTAAQPKDRFITEPKTKTSKRIIMLDEGTISMLKKRYGHRTSDTWVFADKYGELLSPWYCVKYFRNACYKADMPIRRFYDLRHTHITELAEAGIALPIIQKRVGHSNINMTMHYTHIHTNSQNCIVEFINSNQVNLLK